MTIATWLKADGDQTNFLVDSAKKSSNLLSKAHSYIIQYFTQFNLLNPHDALKHHFASLKNDLISYNL